MVVSHFHNLQGTFHCDWMTVYSTSPPSHSERWHGSVELGRFERAGSLGGVKARVTREHGRYVVTLTGEAFRSGVRASEMLKDIWHGSCLTAQRLDWAWQSDIPILPLDWTVKRVAQEVHRRLPEVRYGWGISYRESEGGHTYYIGALDRPGTRSDGGAEDRMESARSKPLFIRVYQRVGGCLRIEAECKQMSGVSLRYAVEESAALCSTFMPGRPSLSDMELPPEADVVADGRSAPDKLLKQAWGLLKAAAVRTGKSKDGVLDYQDERWWASLVQSATGLSWQSIRPVAPERVLKNPGGVIQGSERLARAVPGFFDQFCRKDRTAVRGSSPVRGTDPPGGEGI